MILIASVIKSPTFEVIAKIDFLPAPDLPVVLPLQSKSNILWSTQPAADFCNYLYCWRIHRWCFAPVPTSVNAFPTCFELSKTLCFVLP
jgi:hypothetical protein